MCSLFETSSLEIILIAKLTQIDVIERGSRALQMHSFPVTDHYPQTPLSTQCLRPRQRRRKLLKVQNTLHVSFVVHSVQIIYNACL